jgi:YidC/Oxa1 family membrane protein insertase
MMWITDLSSKDPFYVLPVLMAIAMFFQQKLTPISDPQQAKILKWMPLIFAIFMIALPSGLALYILISTLFGIAQQKAFMRDPKAAQAMKTAQA